MLSSETQLRIVIPARLGSQRLAEKPLVDLAGKPMIVRVFDSVKAAFTDHEVIVAVDDIRVMEALNASHIPGVMSDPGCASGTDRVAEVARVRSWGPRDIIINVQGDEPLVPADLLSAFASFCLNQNDFTMATIAVPITEVWEIIDPNVVKMTVRRDGTAMSFSRSPIPFDREHGPEEWKPGNYRRHLGIYAYRNDLLQMLTRTPPCQLEQTEKLEQLRALWLGIPIHVMSWKSGPPAGVDTPDDVLRVVAYLESLQ